VGQWEDYFSAAVALAEDINRAQRANHLARSERDELILAYTDLALDLLRQAVRQGLRDPRPLRQEPGLAPLRSLPEFQAILRTLEHSPA
jgi:hypothetical protein